MITECEFVTMAIPGFTSICKIDEYHLRSLSDNLYPIHCSNPSLYFPTHRALRTDVAPDQYSTA